MALAKGKSEILAPKITPHITNNIEVIEKILDIKFETQEQENKTIKISVEGIGFNK
jgi:RNA 3'-terminal phosphate cyclase